MPWQSHQAASGKTYYHDTTTGVTTWESPYQWSQLADGTGRLYYHNKTTGVTQWDRPNTPEIEPRSAAPCAKRRRTDQISTRAQRLKSGEQLRKAAYQGSQEKIEQLLSELSVVDRLLAVDELDPDDGFSSLHLATIQNHFRVAELLISRRADVDRASKDGDTPLMWAATQGKFPMCKLLLKLGADVSLVNKLGRSAAEQAKGAKHRQIYEILENREYDVAVGLSRRGVSAVKAAAARRAANATKIAKSSPHGESVSEAFDDAAVLACLPEAMRVHYCTLEIPAESTAQDARKAYRKLALKHHPDRNVGDEVEATKRFGSIAFALETICEYLAGL